MMSCPVSAAWNRPILSLCCIEPGPSRDAIMSGYITILAMFRSGQLTRHCTVGTHCSGLHVCSRLSNT
jgi:hypothetical protein